MNSLSTATFFHYVFVCFVALFPPVNPFGTSLVVGPFLRGCSTTERLRAAAAIALYCLGICLTFTFIGGLFFKVFGISVPVVQLTGGLLIARMGLLILSTKDVVDDQEKVVDESNPHARPLRALLFYPLAFPTTTGGGAISVLLALSANSYHVDNAIHLFNLLATSVACVLMAGVIFACYALTPTLLSRLNNQALQVCNKLSGFLTACVGIQIMVDGVLAIAKILIKN